jgi:hypothetical protein
MRGITLDWPQFVMLVLGLCTIAVVVAIMLMRDAPGPLARPGVCEREGYKLAHEKPQRIDGKMPAPKRLRHTAPTYPDLPQGTVGSGSWMGEVLIDPSGTIRHIWPVREVLFTPPFPAFNTSIVDAIRQWQYEPSWFDDQPVFVCMTVTVTIEWR